MNGFTGTETEWLASLEGATGPTGPTGATGPAGPGVAAGGTAGQVLSKIDGTDYNTQWISSVPFASYTSTVKHEVKLGEAIAKGQAVYISSADGTNMIASKASNASEGTSSKTMGLLETGGALNDKVNVVTEGLLAGLDTTAAITEGVPVWLGTSGNLLYGLANKPVAPAHLVFVGVVTRVNANNGEIFVRPQNGFELHEIHDVLINGVTAGEVIQYTSSNLWENKTLTEAGISAIGHTHTIGNVTGLQTALDGKADDATTLAGYGITDAYTKTQVDTSLSGKANTTHSHAATDITSGAFDIARIPTGSTGTTVALGNHNHTLDSLSNVTIASNASGELLKWNGTAWVNNTLAEAGISAVGHGHSIAEVAYLQTALNLKADDATTLAGYGITDAYTSSSVDSLLSAKLTTPTWTAWTPTLGGFVQGTGAVTQCYYTTIGKTVIAQVYITLGTGPTVTGGFSVSLPVDHASSNRSLSAGTVLMRDSVAARNYTGAVYLIGSAPGRAQFQVFNVASTYQYQVSQTASTPHAWTSGDYFSFTIVYQGV
jgi:hypothetical protein